MIRCAFHGRLAVAIALLYASALHAMPPSNCVSLVAVPVRVDVQWPEVWQALDQQAGCTENCHSGSDPAAGLNLSNVRLSQLFLVEQFSAQDANTQLVESGFPERSLFFNKVNCQAPGVGARMPPGGSLSANVQALIFDWIEYGARGENVEEPILRDFIFRDGSESTRRVFR